MTSYQKPHKAILDLALVDIPPLLRLNHLATHGILLHRHLYKSLEEISAPELGLAGIRFNPVTLMDVKESFYTKMEYFDPQSKTVLPFDGHPIEAKIARFSWNQHGDKVAFLMVDDDGPKLWLADIVERKMYLLLDDKVNVLLENPYAWLDNEDALLVKVDHVVENMDVLKHRLPTGPKLEYSNGEKAQNYTYQDLLNSPEDSEYFEYLATCSVRKVYYNRVVESFLPLGMYEALSPSPDEKYVIVTKYLTPFSYQVPYSRFPSTTFVVGADGAFVQTLRNKPLIEALPQGFMAVQQGRRNFKWQATAPATINFVEALDEGDPSNEVSHRDAIFAWEHPFDQSPKLIFKTKERYSGLYWVEENLGLVFERWWPTRNQRTIFFTPGDFENYVLFNERNFQNVYDDPGNFTTQINAYGMSVIYKNGNEMFLSGEQYDKNGKAIFLDKYHYDTKKTTRIYKQTDSQISESILSILNYDTLDTLMVVQSKTAYPNQLFKNLKTGTTNVLTFNQNPFAALDDLKREIINYKRSDDVELSAILYTPAGYDKEKDGRLPLLMWAYPTDYKDKTSASQQPNDQNEFVFPYYGSPIYWANRGYAILDRAAFPILGENDALPNDNYIEQLVENARAAIQYLDDLGIVDPQRVAVGGHSYGAFMVANLLTHSSVFAAGIARSGAYNRTLTPFGFQSEERNFWQAPDVYNAMSPFNHADKMKTPLLLIHGEDDKNPGTHTMQSERYFQALKGLGGPAKLVILPKEGHGYTAQESILHVLYEQDEWLETYVKNKNA